MGSFKINFSLFRTKISSCLMCISMNAWTLKKIMSQLDSYHVFMPSINWLTQRAPLVCRELNSIYCNSCRHFIGLMMKNDHLFYSLSKIYTKFEKSCSKRLFHFFGPRNLLNCCIPYRVLCMKRSFPTKKFLLKNHTYKPHELYYISFQKGPK